MVRTQAAGRYEFHRAMFFAERFASSRHRGTWPSSGSKSTSPRSGGSTSTCECTDSFTACCPLVRELRRNIGRLASLFRRGLRLLSSDEEFETFGVAKRRRESTFFQLNTISVEFGLFWEA